jgi:hypothetical protein
MSVLVELHNTGDATIRTEVQVIVEHVLSDRPGEWRVSIVGSRAKEDWEMKVEGPNGFERSYTLVGTAGELSRRAVPERSGVVTRSDGSGEKTRGQAQPRSCFCLAESGSWNGEKTGWSGTGTKTDRNQHTMGTLGVSEAGEAWDWRLTDSQERVKISNFRFLQAIKNVSPNAKDGL